MTDDNLCKRCGKRQGDADSIHTRSPQVESYHTNAAKTVVVSDTTYWQPIETCPTGLKVQLLGKGNVATYGTYYGDLFWTHWCALPKKLV